jgi:hypothetical protein
MSGYLTNVVLVLVGVSNDRGHTGSQDTRHDTIKTKIIPSGKLEYEIYQPLREIFKVTLFFPRYYISKRNFEGAHFSDFVSGFKVNQNCLTMFFEYGFVDNKMVFSLPQMGF